MDKSLQMEYWHDLMRLNPVQAQTTEGRSKLMHEAVLMAKINKRGLDNANAHASSNNAFLRIIQFGVNEIQSW